MTPSGVKQGVAAAGPEDENFPQAPRAHLWLCTRVGRRYPAARHAPGRGRALRRDCAVPAGRGKGGGRAPGDAPPGPGGNQGNCSSHDFCLRLPRASFRPGSIVKLTSTNMPSRPPCTSPSVRTGGPPDPLPGRGLAAPSSRRNKIAW